MMKAAVGVMCPQVKDGQTVGNPQMPGERRPQPPEEANLLTPRFQTADL